MKKILILGSRGFIGNRVAQFALLNDYAVHGIDLVEYENSIYPYKKLSISSIDFIDYLAQNKFDIIINCAGSGNVGYSIDHPLSDFELNTKTVFYVLESIRLHQPNCRYIHLSSAAVYGNPHQLPISENSPMSPISPYGFHKWQSEIICREYAELFNIPILILRPFSVYGPGLRKQLLWDIFQQTKNRDSIELWGSGQETRDFIHIDDLCQIILKISIQELPALEVLNIATGKSISVSRISALLIKNLQIKKQITFNQIDKKGYPSLWEADVSKLAKYGITANISIEEGIAGTATWLLSNEQ